MRSRKRIIRCILTISIQEKGAVTPPSYRRVSFSVCTSSEDMARKQAISCLLRNKRYVALPESTVQVMAVQFEDCGDVSMDYDHGITRFAAMEDTDRHGMGRKR